MSSRRRRFWFLFLAAAGVFAIVPEFFDEAPDDVVEVRAQRPTRARQAASAGPAESLALTLPSRAAGPVVDLFAVRDWTPPRPVAAAPPPPVAVYRPPPPPAPTAPALPFAYLGKLEQADVTRVFLTRGDSLFSVGEGDVIENTYRVEQIEERSMSFRYLPLDLVQKLAVGSAL